MRYVESLREGTPLALIHEDVVGRLHRRHGDAGPGRLCVGMLPQGSVLMYEQGFDGEASCLSVMRKGVLESIKYPWFWHDLCTFDGVTEMCSEDSALCRNLSAAGHTIYVDSKIRVGHQKNLII